MLVTLVLLCQLHGMMFAFPHYTGTLNSLKQPEHKDEIGIFSQNQIPLNTLKEKHGPAIAAALYFGGSGKELRLFGDRERCTLTVAYKVQEVQINGYSLKENRSTYHWGLGVLGSRWLAYALSMFTSEKEANLFIGRRLLYNRFDFEAFTPDNLERECLEELCNYEEAREIFEDPDKTMDFWKDYSTKGPKIKLGDETLQKINVTGLLISLVAAGVLLVITVLLIFYCCKSRCKSRQPPGYLDYISRRRNSSSIFRRHEEFSLNPLPLGMDDSSLPTYEQAVTSDGQHHNIPPPPYPGPPNWARVFKKSMSLPGP